MCTMMQNLGGCCPMAPFELEEGRLLTLEFHRLLLCVCRFVIVTYRIHVGLVLILGIGT